MKNIKTFEDACAALGISTALPEVSALPESEQKAIVAHYKLTVIAKALNNGWKPNWNDWNQWKYYPYFKMGNKGAAPGVGFSCSVYYGDYANSDVGSRLCYESSELAEYAGNQFTDLYKDYYLID